MITRWPGERLRSFDRFNQMMEDFINGDELRTSWSPLVDVKETAKELTFEVELPGLQEKDVNVELIGDTLTISGSRETQSEEKKDEYVRIERSYGSFRRSFTLDIPVKREEINATFKNGLLTVTVPKAENRPTQKIAIEAK